MASLKEVEKIMAGGGARWSAKDNDNGKTIYPWDPNNQQIKQGSKL